VVASKLIAGGLPRFSATALRFAIACPLFLLLMRVSHIPWPRLTRRGWALLLLQAGAGSVGYTTLLISGLRFTAAADAGVIIGTLPVVSTAIAILLLGERPQLSMLIAIALAAIGVVIVSLHDNAGGGHSWRGDLLILGAVCCEGLFILLNKRLDVAIPPLALSTIMSGFGLLVALPPALLEQAWLLPENSAAILAVVYYALVPTIGGFVLWYAGSARVSGSEAAVFTAVAPVAAVTLAFLLLGEVISPTQLFGIGCVLAAVLTLACYRPRPA